MRLLWILLPILAQGARGRLFKVQPQAELVVHQGEAVTLECETYKQVNFCAWKVVAPGLGLSGFLNSGIPTNLDITARDSDSKTDCTITLNNVDSRFNGQYICSPYLTAGGQEDSTPANVVIAQKPASTGFLGDAASGFPLTASTEEPTTVQCQAVAARPKAELVWYLGNTQLYDGVEVEDSESDSEGLVTSVSTLTHQFNKEDNGVRLRCRANHAGYDEEDQDIREKAIEVDVQYSAYRPEGNNIGKIYGFTAGQKDDIMVNFTANPTPTVMSWRVGDTMNVPVGGQSLDGRFTAGNLIIKNASLGMYALKLTIDPVQLEDQSKAFALRLENAVGASELEFAIGTGAAPPPAGNAPAAADPGPAPGPHNADKRMSDATNALGGAAIVGIIVAVLVLLLIIGLVAFGRSRGKWCFAAKSSEARSDRSDTESAHDEKTDKPEKKPVKFSNFFSSLLKANKADADVEMAENKEETRELTRADGEADGESPPPQKEGEVVYAELMLNSDGVKTEVRPSADKTEYAVIVGTKQDEDAADDNKPKE